MTSEFDSYNRSVSSNPYWGDQPLSDPKHDEFGRWPFAERMARTIGSRKDASSLVIGMYGEWGAGKSTVLNYVEAALYRDDHVICVPFNPWRFPDDATLIRNFFQTLADALNRRLVKGKERAGQILEKLSRVLPPISILGIEINAGKGTEELGRFLSHVDLKADKSALEEILQQEMKRVVVLIDDIDRLDKAEIHTLFKLIKLSADFSYVTYVLAFDDEMVAQALSEKYGRSDSASGRRFLEKIIQVPLHLPSIDALSLRRFCMNCIDQVLIDSDVRFSDEDGRDFLSHFVNGIERGMRTPRMAKQYSNALAFSLPLMDSELNTVDLMLTEGMRIAYPALYKQVRINREVFLGSSLDLGTSLDECKTRADQTVEAGISGLSSEEQIAAKALLRRLFPRLTAIINRSKFHANKEATLAKEKRIASEEYFDRYFTYSVPKHDVPDQAVASLLREPETASVEGFEGKLKELAGQNRADAFLLKLSRMQVPLKLSAQLAIALAKQGSLFQAPSQRIILPFATHSSAAQFISQLLSEVPLGEKMMSAAKAIICDGEPLHFSLECFFWMRRQGDRLDKRPLLSEAQRMQLSKRLVRRIKALHEKLPLHEAFTNHARDLYIFWAREGAVGETNSAIAQLLNKDSSQAVCIIRCFLSIWHTSTGVERKLDYDAYNNLSLVVQPDLLADAIKRHYGSRLESLDVQLEEETLTNELSAISMAGQFYRMHKDLQSQSS